MPATIALMRLVATSKVARSQDRTRARAILMECDFGWWLENALGL